MGPRGPPTVDGSVLRVILSRGLILVNSMLKNILDKIDTLGVTAGAGLGYGTDLLAVQQPGITCYICTLLPL